MDCNTELNGHEPEKKQVNLLAVGMLEPTLELGDEDEARDCQETGANGVFNHNMPGGKTSEGQINESKSKMQSTQETEAQNEDKTWCDCCSKLNRSLVIYKAFYFFFLAAIGSLFPYLAVYYKQIWLSARQTGILMGVRPLINLVATPMWGAITDTYKATKFIFILSLIAWLASNYSISLVSSVFHVGVCQDNETITLAEDVLDDIEESMALFRLTKTRHHPHNVSHNNTRRFFNPRLIHIATIKTRSPVQRNLNREKKDVQLSSENLPVNASITDILKFLRGKGEDDNSGSDTTVKKQMTSHYTPNKANKINMLTQIKKEITSRKTSREKLVMKILRVVETTSNSSIEDTGLSEIFKRELAERVFDFLNMDGHYPWPLDTVANYETTQKSDEWEADRQSNLFTILFVITVIGTIVSSPAFTLADTTTLKILGDNRAEYGRQRMWGALGWGLGAFGVGASLSYIQELRGCNNPLSVDYMPCFYAFAVLMGIAILVGGLFEFEDTHQDDSNLIKGLRTLCDYQYLYFILTMLFCGSALGFLQTFLFWHLQDLGGTQFLFSAITAVQCASEVIMYSVSGFLIRWCGYQIVLYLGLLCYAIRFISYAIITNCWIVLPLEVLHGVSHAAVWSAAVVFVGLIPGANNTMQGILGGVHWGLGFGGGGIIGGLLVSWLGSSRTFIVFGIISFIDLGLFALVNNIEAICRRNKNENREEYSRISDDETE